MRTSILTTIAILAAINGATLRLLAAADAGLTRQWSLTDLRFVDEQRGYAVGRGGIVLTTDDGGRSWSERVVADRDLFRIEIASARDLWIVGDGNVLLRSRDGGESWTRAPLPDVGQLRMIRFAEPRIGWLAGDRLYRTEDGGRSWLPVTLSGGGKVYDLRCEALKRCIAVGSGSGIWTSVDEGRRWVRRRVPVAYPYELDRIQIADGGTAWVIGRQHQSAILLTSSDHGESWVIANEDLPDVATNLFFLNSDEGIMSGHGLQRTIDGGLSWSPVLIKAPLMQAIWFVGPRKGWAVGGYGAMFVTLDGGERWSRVAGASEP